MKNLTASIAALAVLGFAGAASAQAVGQQGNASYGVGVEITVAEEVSLWAGDDQIALLMNGQDGNNSATALSSISHINNVAATISATTTGSLPDPIVPGGGINFFLFYNQASTAAAVGAIGLNAYNPAGAAAWNQATLGQSRILGTVLTSTSATTVPVVYASAAPGELPLPDSYDLVVTYTITAD